MKTFLLLFSLLLSFQNIQAQTDTELITQTLTDYIEGSTNGQPKRLKTAFHPDLNLYYVKNNKVATWSGDAYIDDTKEGQPTGESGKILSIDYENNAAVAKVEISHPKSPTPYIDYFMLLKTEGKWTIIHKMFTKKTSTDKTTSSTANETTKTDIPKQSLAQFFYDMTTNYGIDEGLKTLEQYHDSDKFHFRKANIYNSAHILYRNGKEKEAMQLLEVLPKYFPELEQSLAYQLFIHVQEKGLSAAKTWYEKHQNDATYSLNGFELEAAQRTFFSAKKLPEAKLFAEIAIKEFPQEDDFYEQMAEICLAEGKEELALQYLRVGVATYDTKGFMTLAVEPLTTYIPTVLPRDTTLLFEANGNLDSDIAFVFVQGGPMPSLSAYHPRPLTLMPNQDNILRIDVLQSQMINPTVLSANPTLTVEQSLYEHNQSSEMLQRTIKYFKNQGKKVFVIGHSYGCYIGLDYLYTKENLADKLVIMGGDLDEDLRNYQFNEDGSRKFIRWRNGTEPYERDFWGGFPLNAVLQPKMEKIFVNTDNLVSSHGKRRFSKLLKGKDLSNVVFMHAKFDEANARTSPAELEFWHKHGATTIESYGDHHSMLTPAYMTNIYNYLVHGESLKKSVASSLSDDIAAKGIEAAIKNYASYKNTKDYFPMVETEINTLGYQLVAAGKLKDALEVFKLNVEHFPNSWNAYDSLGETYLSLGKKELGEANYRKSLELHPGNIYAIKALKKK